MLGHESTVTPLGGWQRILDTAVYDLGFCDWVPCVASHGSLVAMELAVLSIHPACFSLASTSTASAPGPAQSPAEDLWLESAGVSDKHWGKESPAMCPG